MDFERIRRAVLVYNKNVRSAIRAAGGPSGIIDWNVLHVPPNGAQLMEGVDATPDELIAFHRLKATQAGSRAAMISGAAMRGMASELSMHDVNSNLSALGYALLEIADGGDPEDKRLRNAVTRGQIALKELSNGFEFLYRLSPTSLSSMNGSEIEKLLRIEYAQAISRGDLVIEVTSAFRKSSFSDHRGKTSLAVLSNLVRNGYYWGRWGSGDKERIARVTLDAWQVEVPCLGEPGEEPTTIKRTLVSVEDNGPGVPDERREAVFEPFNSGRRGGKGIGLYLCKAMLENERATLVLDDVKGALGGARFVFGDRQALEREPSPELDERMVLVAVGENIRSLVDEEQWHELGNCIDAYADLQREALRIRLAGPMDDLDRRLVDAADVASGAMAAIPSEGSPRPALR